MLLFVSSVSPPALPAVSHVPHKILKRHLDGVVLTERAEDERRMMESRRPPVNRGTAHPPASTTERKLTCAGGQRISTGPIRGLALPCWRGGPGRARIEIPLSRFTHNHVTAYGRELCRRAAERGRLRCGGQVRRASRGLIVVDDDGVAVFTRNGENMTACSGTTSPMIDPVMVWGESMVDAP